MVRARKGACGLPISTTAISVAQLSALDQQSKKKKVPELKVEDDIDDEDNPRWEIFEDWVVNIHHPKLYPHHLVRRWKDMPEEELLAAGLIQSYKNQREARANVSHQDTGSDFVAFDQKTENYYVGQCKCYTSCKLGQNMKLGGFFLQNGKRNIYGGFLYSYSELSQPFYDNLRDQTGEIVPHVVGKEFEEYYKFHYPKSIECDVDDSSHDEVSLSLRPHQVRAIAALCEPNENDRQYLHMACGTGKTKVCGHVLQNKRPKVIICAAPLLMAGNQLKRRLPSYLGDDYKILLVDSDTSRGGTTDPEEVRQFLLENDRVIIFTTFKRFNITASLFVGDSPVRSLSDAYLVVNEVHNVYCNNRLLVDCIKTFPHSLYMSATIPVELVNDLGGRMSFNYSVASAINDSQICDYRLILPRLGIESGVDDDDDDDDDGAVPYLIDEDNGENDAVTYFSSRKSEMKAKTEFLVTGMQKKGSKRCIVYLSSSEECKLSMKLSIFPAVILCSLHVWVRIQVTLY